MRVATPCSSGTYVLKGDWQINTCEISGGDKNTGEKLSRVGGWGIQCVHVWGMERGLCFIQGDQRRPSSKLLCDQRLKGVREASMHGYCYSRERWNILRKQFAQVWHLQVGERGCPPRSVLKGLLLTTINFRQRHLIRWRDILGNALFTHSPQKQWPVSIIWLPFYILLIFHIRQRSRAQRLWSTSSVL